MSEDRFSDTCLFQSNKDLLIQALDAQVHFFFNHEVCSFRSCREWNRAQSVLDIGCAHGAYLSMLRQLFTDKQYTGIDTSNELIICGQKRADLAGVRLVNQDLFDHSGNYDAIVCRLVMQHVRSTDQLLAKCGELLSEGGVLIVIDGALSGTVISPELQSLTAFYDQLNEQRRESGYSLDPWDGFTRAVAEQNQLRLMRQDTWLVPTTVRDYKSRFCEMESAIVRFVCASKIVAAAYEDIITDIETWERSPESAAFEPITVALLKQEDLREHK